MSAISERDRRHLHEQAEASMDHQAADTLMDLLPPDGWGNLATKTDLALVTGALETRIGALENRVGALETRMGVLEKKVDALDEKVDALDKKMDDLGKRFGGLARTIVITIVATVVSVGGIIVAVLEYAK